MDILETYGLRLGLRVEIAMEDGPTYQSMVEDVRDGRFLSLSSPIHKGQPVALHRGDEVQLCHVQRDHRLSFAARIVGFYREGHVRFVLFEPRGGLQKAQLRGAYRLKSRFGCAALVPAEEEAQADTEELVSTADISTTGLGFYTTRRYEPGDSLILRVALTLPEGMEHLELTATVRRRLLQNPQTGIYLIGVEFAGLDNQTAKKVYRYVLTTQQIWLRQGRR